MRVAKQAIGLNIVRAVLKSKRRTEERMMPGNCREEEKKRKKEKMKKRRKEEGCFENSFASSTMRGPPMTYVYDEKTSQELRMLSRSLSDCKSLLLNVMIQVSQFIRNGQLCH